MISKKKVSIVVSLIIFFTILNLTFSLNSYRKAYYTYQNSANFELNDIFFLNESVGWVVSDKGHIFSTQNGGRIWKEQFLEISKSITQIQFLSEKVGWVLGGSDIFRSSDGGITWDLKTGNLTINFEKFCFVNENNGWAITNFPSKEILTTNDSGRHWYSQKIFPIYEVPPLPPPWGYPLSNLKDIFFLNETYGFVLYQGNFSTNPINLIYFTNNSGSNWTQYTIANQGNLERIYFINEFEGWAIGNRGAISFSNNSGVTWKNQYCPSDEDLENIFLLNNSCGWICGNNSTLLYTQNRGSNWTKISNLSRIIDFKGMYFENNTRGWIIGSIPELFTTDDGGYSIFSIILTSFNFNPSWIITLLVISGSLLSIAFLTIIKIDRIKKNPSIRYLQEKTKRFQYLIFDVQNKKHNLFSLLFIGICLYGSAILFVFIHECGHAISAIFLGGFINSIEINYTLYGFTDIQGDLSNFGLLYFNLAGIVTELIIGIVIIWFLFSYIKKSRFLSLLSIIISITGLIFPLFYFAILRLFYNPLGNQDDLYQISKLINLPYYVTSLFFLPFLIISLYLTSKLIHNFYKKHLNSEKKFLCNFFLSFIIFITFLLLFHLLNM